MPTRPMWQYDKHIWQMDIEHEQKKNIQFIYIESNFSVGAVFHHSSSLKRANMALRTACL